MALSIDDLITPMTVDEIRTNLYNILASTGVNTTTWKPGAVVRTLITGNSILAAAFSTLIAQLGKNRFLELASGDWLTLVALYGFDEERQLATFAAGEVTLTNGGGGVFDELADDVIVTNPDTGKSYRINQDFHLGVGDPPLTVTCVAIEAGSASSAVIGGINAFETTLLGVTVTNELALVGLDDEEDPPLKARCQEKLGPLSPNGPWDAYTYIAKKATREDGSPIGVTRVRIDRDGYGNVFVYVATATGPVSGDAGDPDTDLGIIAADIQRLSVPLCITAHVLSAVAKSVSVPGAMWLYNTTGRNESEVDTAVALALSKYLASRPIGGDVISGSGAVYLSALEAVVGTVYVEVFKVVLSGSDTTLAINEVPVLGSSTVTVNFVAPPVGF